MPRCSWPGCRLCRAGVTQRGVMTKKHTKLSRRSRKVLSPQASRRGCGGKSRNCIQTAVSRHVCGASSVEQLLIHHEGSTFSYPVPRGISPIAEISIRSGSSWPPQMVPMRKHRTLGAAGESEPTSAGSAFDPPERLIPSMAFLRPQKMSTTSRKLRCLEGNVQIINDEGAVDVAHSIDLHEPSFVRFPRT